MEAQAALVGPQCAGELHAVAAIHLLAAVVVQPRHAKVVALLGLGDGLEHLEVARLAAEDGQVGHEVMRHLCQCLQELGLLRVAPREARQQRLKQRLGDVGVRRRLQAPPRGGEAGGAIAGHHLS